jgi:hypothetical protein
MITEEDLKAAGFVQVFKEMQGESIPTDKFILPGWDPTPRINWEDRNFGPVIQIEGLQRRVDTVEGLNKFITSAVPRFCDSLPV